MRVRTRLFTAVAVGGALVAPLVPLGSTPAGAVSTPAIDRAVEWLLEQQQPDGGFETADFPGFETPDAVFALAASSQDASWDTTDARGFVEGLTVGDDGPNPLDAVDDWVDDVQTSPSASVAARASQAAKVIVLVAAPLGLPATDFDPSDDTVEAVDLSAALDAAAGPDGRFSDLLLGGKVYAAWALQALSRDIPAGLVDEIGSAQQFNGGFAFEGDPDGVILDPDLTASVVLALHDETSPAAQAITRRAIVGLALEQRRSGQWAGAFDDGNVNSTAVVLLAAASQGAHPDEPCWRDQPAGQPPTSLAGLPYPSPVRAIEARQDATAGYFRGPFDEADVPNTFATSQVIQGLAAAAGAAYYRLDVVCDPPVPSANRRLVNSMYADLLRRPAEEGGAVYWTGRFDGGLSPAFLAKSFTGTAEYARKVLTGLTTDYLGRVPDAAEQRDLAPVVRAGRRLDAAATILGGAEHFQQAGANNAGWAAAVYQDALGRAASPQDVRFVTDRLQAGASRLQMARSLLRSDEGRRGLVRETYRELLRRDPEPGGLTHWAGEVARGVSPERLVTLIIGSAEYRRLTAPPA